MPKMPENEASKEPNNTASGAQSHLFDHMDQLSETEIATELIVPEEGGWGWVVVAASFMCIFILDGIFFSFGSLYTDISVELGIDVTLVTLVNSVAMALYLITGPVVSAFINRFGFRSCTMAGSVIVSFSYLLSYFARSYIVFLLFYGIIPGFGGCFISMSSQLIVGFYFERLRAMATAIAGLGQSFGVTVMSNVNTYIVSFADWRTTTLLHSGLFGTIYFLGMTYRPLLSLTLKQKAEDTQTVTYLPSISVANLKKTPSQLVTIKAATTASERLFSAVSNINYPTAIQVLDEGIEEGANMPGPSKASSVQLFTLKPRTSASGISQRMLKRVQFLMSRYNVRDKESKIKIELNNGQQAKKRHWWSRCCRWERDVEESRPMYRDDAFYCGKVQNLPAYKKSMGHIKDGEQGLEYQMAVSRTVATADLADRKGVFTIAVRRILATMMDPQLLRRSSFFMICTTGFLVHVGTLVPFVFLANRNKSEGVQEKYCTLFVSVIGVSNGVGRLVAGVLAYKFDPIKLYCAASIFAGMAVMATNVSFNVNYQYCCCVIFGVSIAHMSTLRSLVLVNLYGLDLLTNCTGILLMSNGFGTLFSTPLASVLQSQFGYSTAFNVAGIFIISGGIILLNVKTVAKRERKSAARKISRKQSSVTRKKRK